MARQLAAVDHEDACKAVAFLTGVSAADVNGYAVIVLVGDAEWKITGNQTTKAACAAYIADGLAALALEVASDLDGVLKG